MTVPGTTSIVLFALVGVIALTMAWKGLSARSLLPFHQAASGRAWEAQSAGEQAVAVALTRSLGLGFIVAAFSLAVAAAAEVAHDRWLTLGPAGVALVFCAGLALINRRLTVATGVGTPWKESSFATVAIGVGMALAMA
jgi:hypothetical protein